MFLVESGIEECSGLEKKYVAVFDVHVDHQAPIFMGKLGQVLENGFEVKFLRQAKGLHHKLPLFFLLDTQLVHRCLIMLMNFLFYHFGTKTPHMPCFKVIKALKRRQVVSRLYSHVHTVVDFTHCL